MITIYCALYAEAQYLIQHYELKKAPVSRHFQVFVNEKKRMRVVISGVGKTNAAVAVAEISTIDPPAKTDLMINYGSCAGETMHRSGAQRCDGGADVPSGSIIMVNKLTDMESGRTFYPDMIFRHSFFEGEVETSVHLYTADADVRDKGSTKADVAGKNVYDESVTKAEFNGRTVHDMEAAAFYEAGNFFYGPHQMMFLKVVTDHGNDEMDKERFAQIMQTAGAPVAEFLDGVLAMMQQDEAGDAMGEFPNAEQKAQGDEQGRAERLAEDLHCSVTMRAELMQLLTYWQLAGFDVETVLEGYYAQGLLPCKNKRTGRRLLDELQNKWL